VSRCFILLGRCGWRCRILGIEQLPTTLPMMYIAQEIEVVVEEVWQALVKRFHGIGAGNSTKLGDICQTFDFGQLQLLQLFCGQTTRGIETRLHSVCVFSLVRLLTRHCRLIWSCWLRRPYSRRSVLFTLLSSRAAWR